MKIIFAILALCIGMTGQKNAMSAAGPVDKTTSYPISASQKERLISIGNAIKSAHTSEQFDRAWRGQFKVCEAIKAEIKAPATALCDTDKGTVRGANAK